jgi:hypothetical protein
MRPGFEDYWILASDIFHEYQCPDGSTPSLKGEIIFLGVSSLSLVVFLEL